MQMTGNTSFRHMPIRHSRFAIVSLPYDEHAHARHTHAQSGLVSPAGLG